MGRFLYDRDLRHEKVGQSTILHWKQPISQNILNFKSLILNICFLRISFLNALNSFLNNSVPCHIEISELTFTCLKSTIETLEKGVKYVQS